MSSTASGPKVICLGLGRTGTLSLRAALEILGFGPCFHLFTLLEDDEAKDFAMWCKVGDGKVSTEELREFLKDCGSIVDYPQAMYPDQMYAAFPDAKFILTTRDPEKWAKSMATTILPSTAALRDLPDKSYKQQFYVNWFDTYMNGKYHRGRLGTHGAEEITAHIERVKQIIPPEKLLIYQVSEGWDRLVEWLEVPKPTVPFPHVNDKDFFQGQIKSLGMTPDSVTETKA